MRKLCALFMTVIFALSTVCVYAEDNTTIKVKSDGVVLQFDVPPVIENGRVLVPMRVIFSNLGCSVSYNRTDDGAYVTAAKGNDNIQLKIGSDEMSVNDKTIKLDVPAKIIDSRTFVPLRAVSEGLGIKTEWQEDTKTVILYSGQEKYSITAKTEEHDVKNDAGDVLVHISCSYPVIENSNSSRFIEDINKQYKDSADAFIKEAEGYAEDAKALYDEMSETDGAEFTPFAFELTYTVNTEKNNMLSITEQKFMDTHGAHPTTERTSHTFDTENEKELSLSDVIDAESEGISNYVYDLFLDWYNKNTGSKADSEVEELIKKEAGNVKFYVTDTDVVLYFDVYQIAPYAAGYPEVRINDTGNILKIILSENDSDAENENNKSESYSYNE